ncbi:MAG: diguanylate cyclase [Dechloromonas sp.]|nr:diguanylate cyclase [Dechloromonas sp.]
MPPTPANYQACYNEIAGFHSASSFPEGPLLQLLGRLPAADADAQRLLESVRASIQARSWLSFEESMLAYALVLARRGKEAASDVGLPEPFVSSLRTLLDAVLPVVAGEDAGFRAEAEALHGVLAHSPVERLVLQDRLVRLAAMASMAGEEQQEIKSALLKLLHLVIENIGHLSLDDQWLKGQVDGLLAAVEPPLTLRHLDEIERRLRDVIDKQLRAKQRSVEAQSELRQMLSFFIDYLASVRVASSGFQVRIEGSAQRLAQVERIEELAPLLAEVVEATRRMAEETAASQRHLQSMQEKVLATEAELIQLHLELDNASNLARHDPLTDALNRKGLDEALAREIAVVRRYETPLSICLLDIDNFKLLNDQLGHAAGDQALIHLVSVTRQCMRPSDTLARYGGEEFVILMPDTPLDKGVDVITRLQRELTKAIFMADSARRLITFSAGVAQLTAEESGEAAMVRADRAMYLAKRAGKNRVFGA